MNVMFQNILTRNCLRNKENLPIVTLALSTSSRSSSSLSSKEVFSEKSRKRCMTKIGKMKSMRPSDVPVTKRAAVLVPLVDIAGSPHLLYTRRSMGMSSHSGQVSFPGGKEDEEDEDIVKTALRETEEELGIPMSQIDVWCQMPELSSSRQGDYVATPVVAQITNYDTKKLTLSPGEVASVFTVPLDILTEPKYHGYTQFRKLFRSFLI